jgi:initiation factor 1A
MTYVQHTTYFKMVKNTTGGNKAKGKARKLNDSGPRSNAYLRTSTNEFELYAQVSKVLGNGMCHVVCVNDGVMRLCHIRGKFRGRGKSDNIVKNGTWLLVGLREWENGSSGGSKKLQNCDLLEVYSEIEKEKLKTTVKLDWSTFLANDNKNANLDENTIETFVFSDQKEDEYNEILKASSTSKTVVHVNNDDEIDIDDI